MKNLTRILSLTAILSATILSGCSFHIRQANEEDFSRAIKEHERLEVYNIPIAPVLPLAVIEIYPHKRDKIIYEN